MDMPGSIVVAMFHRDRKVAHSPADNDGEAWYGAADWHGSGLDLKIQAVDDDGCRTSMDAASSSD